MRGAEGEAGESVRGVREGGKCEGREGGIQGGRPRGGTAHASVTQPGSCGRWPCPALARWPLRSLLSPAPGRQRCCRGAQPRTALSCSATAQAYKEEGVPLGPLLAAALKQAFEARGVEMDKRLDGLKVGRAGQGGGWCGQGLGCGGCGERRVTGRAGAAKGGAHTPQATLAPRAGGRLKPARARRKSAPAPLPSLAGAGATGGRDDGGGRRADQLTARGRLRALLPRGQQLGRREPHGRG